MTPLFCLLVPQNFQIGANLGDMQDSSHGQRQNRHQRRNWNSLVEVPALGLASAVCSLVVIHVYPQVIPKA